MSMRVYSRVDVPTSTIDGAGHSTASRPGGASAREGVADASTRFEDGSPESVAVRLGKPTEGASSAEIPTALGPHALAAQRDAMRVSQVLTTGLANGVERLRARLGANPDPAYATELLSAVRDSLASSARADPAGAGALLRLLRDEAPGAAAGFTGQAMGQPVASKAALAASPPGAEAKPLSIFHQVIAKATLAAAQALARTDPAAAAQMLDRFARQLPADERAAFVKEAEPVLTTISEAVGDLVETGPENAADPKKAMGEVDDTLATLADVAQLSGPSGAEVVGRALVQGIPDPDVWNGTGGMTAVTSALRNILVRDPGSGAALTGAIRDALSDAGVAHQGYDRTIGGAASGTSSADAVHQARTDYEKAQAQVDRDNADLSAEIGEMNQQLEEGGASKAEIQAMDQKYAAEFRKRHAKDYEAAAAAAKKLGTALEQAAPLIGLGGADGALTAEATAAAKDLEDVPGAAKGVLAVANALASNPGAAPQATIDELAEHGATALYVQASAEHPGDPEAASEAVSEDLETLHGLQETVAGFSDFVEGLKRLASNPSDPLAALNGLDTGNSPFGKALKACGMVLGILQAATDGGDPTQLVQSMLGAGADAADLAAGALKGMTGVLGDLGDFAEKLAPVLGVAAGALALALDATSIHGGADVGKVIADVVGGIALFFGTDGVAGVVEGVAAAAHFICSVVGSVEAQERIDAEEADIFGQILGPVFDAGGGRDVPLVD